MTGLTTVDDTEGVALPAEPASVPALRALARGWAQTAGMTPEQVSDVELAVTEAATNALLHAFVDRPAGTIRLRLAKAEGQLVIRVSDDGRGLTPRIDSPGLGLGLPTIGRVADHVDIGPSREGGTEVKMVFAVPAFRDAEGAEALRRRLAASYDGLTDAVLVHDGDGRFVYANPPAIALLGLAEGERLTDREPGETAARYVIALEDGTVPALEDWPHRRLFLGEDHPAPLLTRNVELATGTTRWHETSATPLVDEPTGRRLSLGIVRDVTGPTEAALRERLLAEAGRRLSLAVTDLPGTFEEIAALAVPAVADWCAVDVVDEDGVLQRVGLAHRDPAKVALGRCIHERWPPDPAWEGGPYAVLRAGEPSFLPVLDESVLQALPDPAHRAALLELGMRSVVQVPMRGRVAVLGVLTFVAADSGRRFDEDVVAFAGELADRAGVAIENARLIEGRRDPR